MSQGVPPQMPPVIPLQYTTPMPTSAVRGVGLAQRRLMWVILGAILLTISLVAGGAITSAVSGPAAIVVLAVMLLVRLALIALMMICVYQMTAALGWSMAGRVVCVVCMIIPLVGLILLLVVNQSATNLLRRAGVRVGLMGPRVGDLPPT